MKEIMPDISQGKKNEMGVCPHCGPLNGGPHSLPDCPYREELEEKAVLPAKTAEAPSEKEKEMTPGEEGEFRKKLLERAKAHEEFVKAPSLTGEPVVEIPKPLEIPKPEELKKEKGVFEELFMEEAKIKESVVEKPARPELVEGKEIIPPAVEPKAARSDLSVTRRAVSEVKEVKKELKKEEVAANAVVAAVEIARDFISAGSAKITDEQVEKAALAALKDWERITTGMTAAERYETFSAAERTVLDKIPEGRILEKIKGKIFVEVKEEPRIDFESKK